jgi:hypothetical protein
VSPGKRKGINFVAIDYLNSKWNFGVGMEDDVWPTQFIYSVTIGSSTIKKGCRDKKTERGGEKGGPFLVKS